MALADACRLTSFASALAAACLDVVAFPPGTGAIRNASAGKSAAIDPRLLGSLPVCRGFVGVRTLRHLLVQLVFVPLANVSVLALFEEVFIDSLQQIVELRRLDPPECIRSWSTLGGLRNLEQFSVRFVLASSVFARVQKRCVNSTYSTHVLVLALVLWLCEERVDLQRVNCDFDRIRQHSVERSGSGVGCHRINKHDIAMLTNASANKHDRSVFGSILLWYRCMGTQGFRSIVGCVCPRS
jgi:hypothetical protein